MHVLLLHGHWGEQAAGVQPVLYLLPVPCRDGAPGGCWREHPVSSAGGSTSRREHYKMGALIEGGVLSEGDLGRSGEENGRGKGSTRGNRSTARRERALPGVEHYQGSTEGRRALLKAEHCQRETSLLRGSST